MKKETLKELLALSKSEKTAEEVIEMIKNYEDRYEDGTDGTTIKLRFFKGADGKVVTEICSLLEYRDISKMDLKELRAYYEELEDQYDEVSGDEPDDEDSDEYDDWEDLISELEDEMEAVKDRIDEMVSNQ